MISFVLLLLLLFEYSLASDWIERSIVTAPIVFTLAGMLRFPALATIRSAGMNSTVFLRIAEVGLVLLLFTDASRTDLTVLQSIKNLPARLLSTGMLLTIALGALAAKVVFPSLPLWEAGILSAILAPTDAGLGQVIVNSPPRSLGLTPAHPNIRNSHRGRLTCCVRSGRVFSDASRDECRWRLRAAHCILAMWQTP
jgi:sodium/hydrogen antiporter